MKRSYFCLIFLFLIHFSLAQQVQLEGQFATDSIKVGERIHYSLKASYPINQKILFPDSLFDFSPFEFVSKTYFPTYQNDNILIDSAVYELTTFELDEIQTLALPVFVLNKRDSIAVFAQSDTVWLKSSIEEMPTDIVLKESNQFRPIDYLFNYPYLVIGILLTIVALLLIWVFFGKKIKQKYLQWRWKKRFEKFSSSYDNLYANLTEQSVLELSNLWKEFLEKMLKKPISKWTSKEINAYIRNNELENALHQFDQFLYSSQKNLNEVKQAAETLKAISEQKYLQKREEIARDGRDR